MKKILLLLLASLSLRAEQFALLFYNDAFAGTDQHFTNGLGLSWFDNTFKQRNDSNLTAYSRWMYDLADTVSLGAMDGLRKHTAGIGVSQIIITPDDLTQSVPQYNDVPYAGYLALSFYLFEWDSESFIEYRIDTGVVGKESGAEQVQKAVHKILGDRDPKGWDTQLGTEWIFNVLYRRGHKSWVYHNSHGLSMDWFNHFGFQAGNYTTDVFAGTMFRLGQNYIENFNVAYPYLREEAALLHPNEKHQGFGWSLSVGVSGEVLLYSYLLEESQKKGYALEDNTFNFSPYAGVSLYYDEHKLTFFYQAQSYTLNGDRDLDTFGGIRLDIRF
jgi:hypothetical protein